MKYRLIIFSLCIMQFACSKSSDTSDVEEIKNPTSVNLIFPHENSLCNEGTNLTLVESTVLFEWHASDNTDNYVLNLKNLSTGISTNQQSTSTEISIVISRETPYEWYVISQSNSVNETAKSTIWQFYNAGEGVQSYAPFPAEIVFPLMAETINTTASEITLDWIGSDVDDDIIGYDIYIGTTNTPNVYLNDVVESTINNFPITFDTIYYWKIITKDSQGNSSDSGLFQFKIE